jgi:hypothetical protein
MALAEVGFLTMVTEALATAVGAGMLLGGFAAGCAGVVFGWNRPKLDEEVLAGGYIGGTFAVFLALVDTLVSYAG